jgi:NADPH:quinone reductase-like Zn-dependent oxidoreductase
MRAVVITKHGPPGVLQVQEKTEPELSPGEVRIDVVAAGINFADVMARMCLYQDAPKTPCVVGYEVAGTILELGEGVQGLMPGSARVRGHAVRGLRLAGRRVRRRRRRAAPTR